MDDLTEDEALIIGYGRGYRGSDQTASGEIADVIVEDNKKKWSGDHAASDVSETEGILVGNHALSERVSIVDFAPTVYSFFGRTQPSEYTGTSVLATGGR